MHQIVTEIDIAASPERVWSILMDFSAYPQWNPLAGFNAMNQALKNRAEASGEWNLVDMADIGVLRESKKK